MSSSLWREPPSGTIRQGAKVVGAICLPEEHIQEFIEQFNRCYGPLSMHIEPPRALPLRPIVYPVGAERHLPFRPPLME